MQKFLTSFTCLVLVLTQVVCGPAYAHESADHPGQHTSPHSGQNFLNDLDSQAPVVLHTAGSQGVSGQNQILTAEVTDNRGIAEVTLYYRTDASELYNLARMGTTAGSTTYQAEVRTHPGQSRLEYYFAAVDVSGQRTLKGLPYSPFVLTLVNGDSQYRQKSLEYSATSPVAVPPTKSKTKLYVLLGLVALGVVAAAAASGDSNRAATTETETMPPGTVPVTLNVPIP